VEGRKLVRNLICFRFFRLYDICTYSPNAGSISSMLCLILVMPTHHGNTRGQAVVPFAPVCRIEWVENAVTHPLWKVSLVRAATSEGDSHTSISISGQLGVPRPRHLGSCWKGKHDTVCMYV